MSIPWQLLLDEVGREVTSADCRLSIYSVEGMAASRGEIGDRRS